MFHLPEWEGVWVWKSKSKRDVRKNQCKVDLFWVGHIRFDGWVGRVGRGGEGSETLKERKRFLDLILKDP